MIDTISFKSLPQYWWKEYIGLKNNTLRIIEPSDKRLRLIRAFIEQPFELQIEIINTNDNASFFRIVSDITEFEGYYIISWKTE